MDSPTHFPYDPDEPVESYGSIPPYSDFTCPRCRSHATESRNYATKIGCTVGAIAGIGVSLAGTVRGARIGFSVGAIGGPLGATLGGVAGAILDALASGAAGCATGITLGQIIDNTILKNHKCHSCGYLFSTH